jgi:hypothetical protein
MIHYITLHYITCSTQPGVVNPIQEPTRGSLGDTVASIAWITWDRFVDSILSVCWQLELCATHVCRAYMPRCAAVTTTVITIDQ